MVCVHAYSVQPWPMIESQSFLRFSLGASKDRLVSRAPGQSVGLSLCCSVGPYMEKFVNHEITKSMQMKGVIMGVYVS